MTIPRRDWLKLFGLLGLSSPLLLAQSSLCPSSNIKDFDEPVLLDENNFAYWIDGPAYLGSGRLAILLRIKQSTEKNQTLVITRISLTTESNEVVEVRYFSTPQITREGYLPYLIFDRIDTQLGRKYIFTVQVKLEKEEKIYRYVFDEKKLKRSFLSPIFTPPQLFAEWDKLFASQITTVFSLPPSFLVQTPCMESPSPKMTLEGCYGEHFPQIRLVQQNLVGQDGKFILELSNLHPYRGKSHGFASALVTDPVGRVMGVYQRKTLGPSTVQITSLTSAQRVQDWKIGPSDAPNINDCPYVLIFASDGLEALTQTVLYI